MCHISQDIEPGKDGAWVESWSCTQEAETRDGGNLGTRVGAVISHFQDTYLGRAEIMIMTTSALA